jgi:hypothetical protein
MTSYTLRTIGLSIKAKFNKGVLLKMCSCAAHKIRETQAFE